MARNELLNNVTHKNLRVITRAGAQFGDNIGAVLTVPTEYGDIQREYPILFRKDPQGQLFSVALLGFDTNENLFLEGDRWDAAYVPSVVARGPFLIGFQEREERGRVVREPVIHIDLDNPRVSQTEGEPIFLPLGGNAPYLNRITATLRKLAAGLDASKAMIEAFTAVDLIEPLNIEIDIDGQQYKLAGFHTINQEKLANLDAQNVYSLHRAGFLQAAFLIVNSEQNLQRLVERKRRRERRAATMTP
jgi:hypothetical protein